MIDAHAHLADEAFSADLDAVLARAQAAGVQAIVCVAERLQDAARVLELTRARPVLRACIGLYPAYAQLEAAAEMRRLVREEAGTLVGIGEVGLDYWLAKDEASRALQREVLAGFVALSRELDLPLNVHSRSAGRQTIDLLAEHGAGRVLLHAFDGKVGHALRGVTLGYRFSIPPSVVRSRQKQKLALGLPLEALLLESDAPVLGPTPGERNEPANLGLAAEAIATLRGCPVAEVVARTTENARALFRLG